MTPLVSALSPVPFEWLGFLALGILWLNTLLIAASALGRAAALGRDAGRWASAVRGRVTRGDGEGGALATRVIEQHGRAITTAGPDRILFTDRSVGRVEVHGGEITPDGGGAPIVVEPQTSLELWLADDHPSARDETDFATAWSCASTTRGLATSATQALGEGAAVWVAREGGLALSTIAPREDLARKRALSVGFAIGCVVGSGVVTAIALVPPAFGVVSTIGGALGLAWFLAVQPLGTAARDAARVPPLRPLGGIWQRP